MFTLLAVLMWLVPCMHVVSGLVSFACSCVLGQNCMVMVSKLASRPNPAANACWFVQLYQLAHNGLFSSLFSSVGCVVTPLITIIHIIFDQQQHCQDMLADLQNPSTQQT
jgi:hypothetical protein